MQVISWCQLFHFQIALKILKGNYWQQRGKLQKFKYRAGLSINILGTGEKLPVQRVFFKKNSMGDLLPAPKFLSRLYNFCNFVIVFSLM